VYAYQANLAASGGYYISCAADKIYANRNTLTGSIGVITASSFDVTEMLSKIGVKSETIHAGKNKNMFNYNEPVSEEQKQIMQNIADECYEQFTGIVAMSRNIPLFEVKKLADGRIYTAKQALSNGLIDSIDTWENMISNMKLEEFDGKDVNLIEFRYKKDPSLRDMVLGSLFGSATLNSLMEMSEQARLQYPAFIYQTK
ncbi:MAG: S49 family peptidase, partial [Treponema porcinum]|uniref:S49 family peptidase n=1 Tax=Treponema porcinum TaxID=261392 RepID=UPI002A80F61C